MKNSHVATVSSVEKRLSSRPYDRRENFDNVLPQEIPEAGLALDFITIRYGPTNSNRMKIGLCEYADYSVVVDKNVLQSVALHDTLDIRVDFAYPCTDAFFTLFAYPRFTVETTLQFHGADDAVLREHIFLKDMENVSFLFSYSGATPATYFTVTGGANLFIDNVDLTDGSGLIVTNGGFEQGEAGWTLGGNAEVAPVILDPGRHHLELQRANEGDGDAFAEQEVILDVPGTYVLSFDLANAYSGPLPARRGEVSLGSHTIDFAQASISEATMVFLFEMSDVEAGQAQMLRIVKLVSDEPPIEMWYIDNVRLTPVPSPG